MASNGNTSISVTAYDALKFTWAQVSQSAVNNYTIINWSLELVSGSAGQIISSAPKSWTVTINGTTYSGTNSVAVDNNTTVTLASGQVTISHDSDGTKSFTYSFWQAFDITFAGEYIGTKSGSGTGVLNTIARATTPTLNTTSVDMGGTVTIYTSRASTYFTHDLAYSFAGGAYVDIETNVATWHAWAVPLDLADSIPNATSGTMTIRCITKNGSTVIGTKTVLLTVKVPASVVPTIDAVSLTEATAGLAETYGAFIQHKSKIKVDITANGAYGSTIKSYSSSFLSKTYTGATFTTDAPTMYGTLSLVTTVTDSRGRTASKTTSVTVQGYAPPQISMFAVARYNASGVSDPNGTYAWLRVIYNTTPLGGKNAVSARITYKKSTETTWTNLYTRTDSSMSETLKPTSVTFSTDYQYEFKITVSDAFTASSPATYTVYIPSGAVILDIRADGKGIAFFKTSTKDGVEIAGELPGSAINLTTNANLNNLTTPGYYVIPTSAISATITNKPFVDTDTASIEVMRTGDGRLTQIAKKSSKTDSVIYERGYDSSGWGAWSIVYSGAGKILWTGSSLLTASQTVTFGEKMSVQQSGIVLVFSRYISSAAVDYFYSCHFVPKMLVTAATTAGQTAAAVTVTMTTNKFEAISGKYLRITDTGITGDDANSASGTSNGITYNNSLFALRYVIGV